MKIGKRIHVSNSTSAGCRVAIALLSVAFLAGCAGGGGGGGVVQNPSVPKIDLHGDTAGFATLIVADGPKIHGAFNDPFDLDWLKFRGIEGVSYTLQLTGHPAPAPDWGNPISLIEVTILRVDAATQNLNSTGTEGGEPYDIIPIFSDLPVIGGDTRIVFGAPATTTYYIRLDNTSTLLGNYVIKLGTSQSAINSAFDFYTPMSRFVSLFDPDDGWIVWPTVLDADSIIQGQIGDFFLELDHFESDPGGIGEIGERGIGVSLFVDSVTFYSGPPDEETGIQPLNDDPENIAAHIHWGIPHANYPELRLDFTPGPPDDPHPFLVDLLDGKKAMGDLREPGVVKSPLKINGKETSFTKTVTKNGLVTMEDGREMLSFDVWITRDPTDGSKDLLDALEDEAWRMLMGWDWFGDIHYTDDFDVDPTPVATTAASGGAYNVFESDLIMSPFSVVPPPLFPRTPFTLHFDTALQTFQIAYQQYFQLHTDFYSDPFFGTPLGQTIPQPLSPTRADQYAGGVIDIHRGGPGVNGPVVLDLGRVPRSLKPQAYHSPFSWFVINQFGNLEITVPLPPGERHVVKILSDSEMALLRNAYYFGNGIYVDVHTEDNPLGAARADIFFDMAVDGNMLFNKSGADSQGTVTFVSTYADGGDITVVTNGEIRGTIDRASSGALECGGGEAGEAVSVSLMPETYYYSATAEDGTEWDGLVTVGEDSCKTITLSVE